MQAFQSLRKDQLLKHEGLYPAAVQKVRHPALEALIF